MVEAKIKVVVRRAPPEVRVTSDSPIPVLYCDEDGCFTPPCVRYNPLGVPVGFYDGRYPAPNGEEHPIVTFNIQDCTKRTVTDFERGYEGTLTWDLCDKGTIHLKVTKYPTMPSKPVRVTSDSPIPVLYCDEDGCFTPPCVRYNPLGVPVGFYDGRYPAPNGEEHPIVTFNIQDCTKRTVTDFERGYEGTLTWDLCDKGTIHLKVTKYPTMPSKPVRVTSDSPIPVLYCDEDGCFTPPCVRYNPLGVPVGFYDGRYPAPNGEEHPIVTFNIQDCTKRTVTDFERGYEGTLTWDLCDKGTIHLKVTKYPTMPSKPVRVTSDSPIPVLYCDEDGCFTPPCVRYNPLGVPVGFYDGRYPAPNGEEHPIVTFNIQDCTKRTVTDFERGYEGTLTWDLCDKGTIHLKVTKYPTMPSKPVRVTSDSPIPVLYCDEDGCFTPPCVRYNPLGVPVGFYDGRYPAPNGEEHPIVTFNIQDCTKRTVTDFERGYEGTLTWDLCDKGTIHLKVTKYPTMPSKPVRVTSDSPIPVLYCDEDGCFTPPCVRYNPLGVPVGFYDGRYPAPNGEEHPIVTFNIQDCTKRTVTDFERRYEGTLTWDLCDKGTIHLKVTKYPTMPSKPVTITPSELRWTNGTYRASFAIGNLVPSKKYIVSVRMGRHDKTVNSKTIDGVTSYDITTDIPKSEFDATGYTLSCKVFNYTDREWEKTEDYTVPPYEIKGNVDIARSTIPTTIYLEESALFDMMVGNTGDREKEYAVVLVFKNVDTGEEFKFTPENTIRVPARGKGANRIAVVMPSESIPMGEERATFDLIYKLEIW